MIELRRPWPDIALEAARLSRSSPSQCLREARELLDAQEDESCWWINPLGKNVPAAALLIFNQWALATAKDRAEIVDRLVAWLSTSPPEMCALVAAKLPAGEGRKALAEVVIAAVPEQFDPKTEPLMERLAATFEALGSDATAAGLKAFASTSPARRYVATRIAPTLRRSEDVDRLGQLAQFDEETEVREEATQRLGQVRSAAGLRWLKALIASNPDEVPYGTAIGLMRIQTEEALSTLLKAAERERYPGWTRAIETESDTAPRAPLPPAIIAHIKRLLKAPDTGLRVFAAGLAVHWRIPESIALLEEGLSGKWGNDGLDLAARWAASWVDPRTTALLIKRLKSKNEWVRDAAIWAMGRRRVKEAIEPLRALGKKARHGEKSAIRAALALIEQSDSSIEKGLKWMPVGLSAIDRRSGVIEAVAQGDPDVARTRLVRELETEDLGPRAAAALGEMGDPSVAPLLASLVRRYGEDRRREFRVALWKLSEVCAIDQKNEEPEGALVVPRRRAKKSRHRA